jgi:hypothetical protein
MLVEFEVEKPEEAEEFYRCISNAFYEAKHEDDMSLSLASLVLDEEGLTYRTCCGNHYRITKTGKFIYRGTRAGLLRLQPFPRLRWAAAAHDWGVLQVIVRHVTVETKHLDNPRYWEVRTVPTEVRNFHLQVIRYETTTPPEWEVSWCSRIEKVYDGSTVDKAVVVAFDGIVTRVVPYSAKPGLAVGKFLPEEAKA